MAVAEVVYKQGQGRDPMVLDSADDGDRLIEELRRAPQPHGVPHNLAQVYSSKREKLPSGQPDHELLVGIDGERGVGVLSFADASGNVVTAADSGPRFVEYFLAGNVTEFEAVRPVEIPVDEIRRALREFLADGNRPSSVEWQPLEY